MIKTRIGFIGAGGIAERHLGNLQGFADTRVVALADPAVERARAAAARCDARAYERYEEMLECERLDALYICVPPFAHGPLERAAIERHLPFFVEKPLAIDLEVAEAIACQIAANGLVTAVGYHWRYLDITERAHELLDAKPAHLVLGYWLDRTPPRAWWVRQAQSGGQIIEQTTHIFDLARLLVGEVGSVHAVESYVERPAFPSTDVSDVSVATLRFASGAIGAIASTSLLNWAHRIGLHLFCDSMALELSEFDLIVDIGRGRPLQRARGDPFIHEDRDFIDAVQGKDNHIRAPYVEALRSHRLATMAARAAREGRTIALGQAGPHV